MHRSWAALIDADTHIIGNIVEQFWHYMLANEKPSDEDVLAVNKIREATDAVECDDLSGILLAQLIGGLLAVVNVFSTGSPEQSMLLADSAITCVDANVSERTGTSPAGDISTVPEIADELRAQEQMMLYLEGSPTLTADDIDKFRG